MALPIRIVVQKAGDDTRVFHVQLKHTRGGYVSHSTVQVPTNATKEERSKLVADEINKVEQRVTGRVNG